MKRSNKAVFGLRAGIRPGELHLCQDWDKAMIPWLAAGDPRMVRVILSPLLCDNRSLMETRPHTIHLYGTRGIPSAFAMQRQ